MTYWFGLVSFALFGLLFGSFGNVLIWRVPRGESIVSPGSHCGSCGHPVRWYDNIPVISWLVLRGRCRDCGSAISVRYLVIEVVSGLLFGAASAVYGWSAQAAFAALLFWLLLVLSAIDLDTMRLPNPIVGALAVIGVLGAIGAQLLGVPMVPLVPHASSGLLATPLAVSAAGLLLGAVLPGGIAAAYGALRGRSGLGMGDVKLLAVLGIFLGPYVVLVLFLGSVVGIIVGAVSAGEGGIAHRRIPFGPSLAIAGFLTAIGGPAAWGWYVHLIGLS